MINTNKTTAKMASFSSGIMLSRSEAQRQKGDELRMRAAGIDPTKIDEQWLGEVMSRRQKKEAKVDEDVEKEKRLAAELPMEKSEVVSKKPEGRLTWLHKALVLAAKGRIPVPQIYSIIQSSKFTSGVSSKVGLKMKGLVSANLHLFKKEQQKSLQSGRLMDFSKDGASSEEEKKKSKKRKHSDSYSGSSRSRSRSRSSSSRRSDSRKKKKKRKKEKERSRSHDDDRSHEKKEKEREKDSDDGGKKKKKNKDKKEEKAAKEEKAHKEKKEEKSKKDKSHKEEKAKDKEKPSKEERKSIKAAKEAAAKLAQAEEELARAREEEEAEEVEQQEEPEQEYATMSSHSFQDGSQLDERFPPQAQAAGAMGTVKMKLSGWKPACLRM